MEILPGSDPPLFSSAPAPSQCPSVPPSGAPVLQGHVGRIEEHVGVVVVVIAKVAQAGLRVAHFLGAVLSDPGAVAKPGLQRQLERDGGGKAKRMKLNGINSKIGAMSVFMQIVLSH